MSSSLSRVCSRSDSSKPNFLLLPFFSLSSPPSPLSSLPVALTPSPSESTFASALSTNPSTNPQTFPVARRKAKPSPNQYKFCNRSLSTNPSLAVRRASENASEAATAPQPLASLSLL